MTVSATLLTDSIDTSNPSSTSTASISPSGPVLLAVGTNDVSTPTQLPAVSGLGLTWTQVGSAIQLGTAGNYYLSLWIGTGTPVTPDSIDLNFAGNPMNNISWVAIDLDGEAASPVVQSEEGTLGSAGTSLTVTLPSAIGEGNATFGFILRNDQQDVSPGSGYTELGEAQGNLPDITIEAEWRSDGQTTADWSWTTSGGAAGIAVEIAAAAVAADAARNPGVISQYVGYF